ncbi:reverse transcriptase domain-containing protein [Tanacetum coccineum]
MLFPFSLEGAARIWLEKEPPRSIQTWDDLVAKFINQFFPPSKTTNLRNEITNFKQRFDDLIVRLGSVQTFWTKGPADAPSKSKVRTPEAKPLLQKYGIESLLQQTARTSLVPANPAPRKKRL